MVYPVSFKEAVEINAERMMYHKIPIQFAGCFTCRNVENKDRYLFPESELKTIDNRYYCKDHEEKAQKGR